MSYYRGNACTRKAYKGLEDSSIKLDPHYHIKDFRPLYQRGKSEYAVYPFDWSVEGEDTKIDQLSFAVLVEEYYGDAIGKDNSCTPHDSLYHGGCEIDTEEEFKFAFDNYGLLRDSYFRIIESNGSWELTSEQLREIMPDFGDEVSIDVIRRPPSNMTRFSAALRKIIN